MVEVAYVVLLPEYTAPPPPTAPSLAQVASIWNWKSVVSMYAFILFICVHVCVCLYVCGRMCEHTYISLLFYFLYLMFITQRFLGVIHVDF